MPQTIHQLGPPTIMLKGDRVGPTKQTGAENARPSPRYAGTKQSTARSGARSTRHHRHAAAAPPPMSLPGAQSRIGDQAPHTCPANDQKT